MINNAYVHAYTDVIHVYTCYFTASSHMKYNNSANIRENLQAIVLKIPTS